MESLTFLKSVSIFSIVLNIGLIIFCSYLFDTTRFLLLGGLWGIEKTSGTVNPDMSKSNMKAYALYCKKNATTYSNLKRSK